VIQKIVSFILISLFGACVVSENKDVREHAEKRLLDFSSRGNQRLLVGSKQQVDPETPSPPEPLSE
jgi:hypothetical protein